LRVLVDVRFLVAQRRDTMLAVSVAELVGIRQKPASQRVQASTPAADPATAANLRARPLPVGRNGSLLGKVACSARHPTSPTDRESYS
jgi:hypothetical protein